MLENLYHWTFDLNLDGHPNGAPRRGVRGTGDYKFLAMRPDLEPSSGPNTRRDGHVKEFGLRSTVTRWRPRRRTRRCDCMPRRCCVARWSLSPWCGNGQPNLDALTRPGVLGTGHGKTLSVDVNLKWHAWIDSRGNSNMMHFRFWCFGTAMACVGTRKRLWVVRFVARRQSRSPSTFRW